MSIKKIRVGDDFKISICLFSKNQVKIDSVNQKFKFIYVDPFDNSYEISYDGTTRINCYVEGGILYGVFQDYTLKKGRLLRKEYYSFDDSTFNDGSWDFEVHNDVNIELI